MTRSLGRTQSSSPSKMLLTRGPHASWRTSIGGLSVEYVLDGTTLYFRGNREYFGHKLPAGRPTTQADALADRWWRFAAGPESAARTQRALSMDSKLDFVFSTDAVAIVDGVQIDGISNLGVRVRSRRVSAPMTMYVADDGSDLLLAFATGGHDPVWDEFAQWGTATPATPPRPLKAIPELPAWAWKPSRRVIRDTSTQSA